MAAPKYLPIHRVRRHRDILSPEIATFAGGETLRPASRSGLLVSGVGVFGQRVCELCQDGDEV